MKKKYINPEMEVIEIKVQQILAGSPILSEEEYDPEKPIF